MSIWNGVCPRGLTIAGRFYLKDPFKEYIVLYASIKLHSIGFHASLHGMFCGPLFYADLNVSPKLLKFQTSTTTAGSIHAAWILPLNGRTMHFPKQEVGNKMVPNTIISKPKLQMTYVIWGEFLSFWVHSYWTLLDDNGLAWWIRDPGAFGRFDWESP